MISHTRVRELFDYRDGVLYWRTKSRGRLQGNAAGSDNGRYMRVRIAGRSYLYHRVVWLWHHEELPDAVDHINLDRYDNRIENLRAATTQQNNINVTRSHWRGTHFDRKRQVWVAQIRIGGPTLYLGSFTTRTEAKEEYDRTAKEWYGAFYRP